MAAVSGLGRLCAGLAAAALAGLPLVHLQPNRIVSGAGWHLWQWPDPLAPWLAAGGFAVCLTAVVVGRRRWLAVLAAGLGVAGLLAAAGLMARDLLTPGQPFARVSLGAGFWGALLAFGLIAADALAQVAIRPWVRVVLTVGAVGALFGLLASGLCDDLSILREYRTNADRFWQEAGRHVLLVVGSLGPAVVVGIPLGYLCHRGPRLRGAVLPVLEIIQTIPSLAMFGLLMVPLAALAAAVPLLAELGLRGVGAAPALVALFLYALLPIVANTLAGFDAVDPAARDAARGMGMTPAQRLLWVEWPLAQPIVITGIRIVLVQNIGLVAVAALIGGGGLGSFVFRGMTQTALDLVLLGAVPIVILALAAAIVLDALAQSLEVRRP